MNEKIWLRALKDMPEYFIDEDTRTTIFAEKIIAANPKYTPIFYTEENSCWKEIVP